jgi:DNA-binding winged helix-turn-helix (wHTH) protein
VSATRYRFGPFLVSPAHRTLRRHDRDVPLIPRYFDLLVLLVANRHRVVTRQEIFDRVWSDVVVSDGALSQAVRTIRRSLGDDSREPLFIRTVSRHGYQFVAGDVVEETDEGPLPAAHESGGLKAADPVPGGLKTAGSIGVETAGSISLEAGAATDPFQPWLDRLLRRPPFAHATDEERHEAAERLHALGTAAALKRLDEVPGHAEARAILREARWAVPGASDVPLLSAPKPWDAVRALVRLRMRGAARETSNRWGAAALGGTIAGSIAGLAGGVALWLLPESQAGANVVTALAIVGAAAGAIGAAGVGAGLAAAEALARSARTTALALCGAAGGALAGVVAHLLTSGLIAGMFGRDVIAIGGWLEGLVLGGAAGLGYAASTSLPGGGLAGPRGFDRLRTAIATGLFCAAAGIVLTWTGGHLIGTSLDALASAFEGSDVGLAPLASLLGETELRPVTRTIVSAFEGLMFGAGLAFGLTHRPAVKGDGGRSVENS